MSPQSPGFGLRWLLVMGLTAVAILPARAQETLPATQARFRMVDVFVDPKGAALAAYQVEFKASGGKIVVVGVEGGEHAAFKAAPYYDPAALSKEGRVIVAAFSTGSDLPKARTRVARVHAQSDGDLRPMYAVELMSAGGPDGKRIEATVNAVEGDKP